MSQKRTCQTRSRGKSVAILPIVQAGSDPEDEYFMDRITESINVHTGNDCGIESLHYQLRDAHEVGNCIPLGDPSVFCEDYYGYGWTPPSAGTTKTSDSLTLTVFCGPCSNGVVIGSDSFRLFDNGNSVK